MNIYWLITSYISCFSLFLYWKCFLIDGWLTVGGKSWRSMFGKSSFKLSGTQHNKGQTGGCIAEIYSDTSSGPGLESFWWKRGIKTAGPHNSSFRTINCIISCSEDLSNHIEEPSVSVPTIVTSSQSVEESTSYLWALMSNVWVVCD